MSFSRYDEFLAFAVVTILIPGPDFAVVTKNTLMGGRVLVFFLAVLPQFLGPGAGFGWVLLIGSTFAILGMAWLIVVVAGLHGLRTVLARRKVRRALDATTGVALLGFSARLATEHV